MNKVIINLVDFMTLWVLIERFCVISYKYH